MTNSGESHRPPQSELLKYVARVQTEEGRREILDSFSDKLKSVGQDVLGQAWHQLNRLYEAFRNPDTPRGLKVQIGAALLYFVVPTDWVPDFVPFVGYLDDIAVISFIYRRATELLAEDERRRASAGIATPPVPPRPLQWRLERGRRRLSSLSGKPVQNPIEGHRPGPGRLPGATFFDETGQTVSRK